MSMLISYDNQVISSEFCWYFRLEARRDAWVSSVAQTALKILSGRTDQGRLSKPEDMITLKQYIDSYCVCALYKSFSDVCFVVPIKKPNPPTDKKQIEEEKMHFVISNWTKLLHAFKRAKIVPVACGMNRKNVNLFVDCSAEILISQDSLWTGMVMSVHIISQSFSKLVGWNLCFQRKTAKSEPGLSVAKYKMVMFCLYNPGKYPGCTQKGLSPWMLCDSVKPDASLNSGACRVQEASSRVGQALLGSSEEWAGVRQTTPCWNTKLYWWTCHCSEARSLGDCQFFTVLR